MTSMTWVDWLRGVSFSDLQDQLADLHNTALDLPLSTKVIIAIVTTCAGYYVISRPKHRLPPGPIGIPLFGNALGFLTCSFGDAIKKWHSKYGPIVSFKFGTAHVVILNEIEAMNEAYTQRGSDFSGRPQLYSMSILTEGSIFMGQYGELLKFKRKVATQAMRQYISGTQLEDRVHDVLKPIIEDLLRQEGPFALKRHLSFTTWNVLNGICFGSTKVKGDPTFTRLMDVFDEFNQALATGFLEDFFPPLRKWPTKTFRDTKAKFDEYKTWMHNQLDEAKASYDPDHITTLAANIIHAKNQEDDANSHLAALFTDTHVSATLSDVFGGGVDTTRQTLEWIFLVMAIRQDIQAKVHEEIDAVIGEGIPGKEHRSKLVYTEAVIHESMRRYTVAPVGVPHETLRDTLVGGYEIPKGTTVMANLEAILLDPKNWPDPLTFKPERFLDATGTKVVSRSQNWIPFSLGQRGCPGESLAKLQVGYVVTGLLQRLHFRLAPGETVDLSGNVTNFINEPKAYKVIVTPR